MNELEQILKKLYFLLECLMINKNQLIKHYDIDDAISKITHNIMYLEMVKYDYQTGKLNMLPEQYLKILKDEISVLKKELCPNEFW